MTMKSLFRARFLPLWVGLGCAGSLALAQTIDPPAEQSAEAHPVSAVDLKPGPNDGIIANVTARMLEQFHYSHLLFDEEMSSKFLDHYLRDLDPQHIHFLQSDLDEFEGYRHRLNDLILHRGDTMPGDIIFSLFLRRLEQRVDFVTTLLKTEKFTFDGQDRIDLNRKDQPAPKTLEEAKQLWRGRLRYEYLQEKLNLPNPDVVARALDQRFRESKPEEILASIRAGNAKAEALKSLKSGQTNEASEVRIPNEITGALRGKVSDDRADKIAALVLERLPKEPPAAVVQAVRDRLTADNAKQIVDTLTRRYTRILKTFKEWDSDNVLEIYLNALAHSYDPHSDYLGKSSLENFAIGMNLSLFGIGAELRSEDGFCRINRLLPGPAAKSKKIKPNDKIVAVAQGDGPPVDIVDMPLNKAVNLIRGPKGTEVRLTIVPADAADQSTRRVVTLVRDEIKLEDQEAKARIIELPAPGGGHLRLGLIDLPSFYSTMDLGVSRGKSEPRSTTDDVTKLLKKLEKENVSGVILDLRHNGGGSLEEAIRLTGLFIKEGPVVQVRDPDGKVTVDADRDPSIAYDGPLMLLTDRFSASASEIVAGALQDYGRALLVGDISTHGKGTVQSLNSLKPYIRMSADLSTNDPGAVKLTIRKFYRASGLSTQLKGVTPDIVLPSLDNVLDVGEVSLDNPLPYDTIKSAKFEPVNRVAPFLDELRKRSSERVAKEQDFDFVREDIAIYKKAKAEKTVSLNEQQRLKEKEAADDRARTRRLEIAIQPEPDQKVYEIKLEQTDRSGLPAPLAPTNALAGRLHLANVHPQESRLDFQFTADQWNNWGGRLDTNLLTSQLGLLVVSNAPNDLELTTTNAPWLALGMAAPPAWPWNPATSRRVVAAFGRVLAAALAPEVRSATSGSSGIAPDLTGDFSEPDDVSPVDVTLEEAQHILVDYLTLLPRNAIVMVSEPTGPRPGVQTGISTTQTRVQ